MRQNASDLVRPAEGGEQVTITVSGRPAAVLGPVAGQHWRQWSQVSDAFRAPLDSDWAADLAQLDDAPLDPWTDS